jgi:hypothetical protein
VVQVGEATAYSGLKTMFTQVKKNVVPLRNEDEEENGGIAPLLFLRGLFKDAASVSKLHVHQMVGSL